MLINSSVSFLSGHSKSVPPPEAGCPPGHCVPTALLGRPFPLSPTPLEAPLPRVGEFLREEVTATFCPPWIPRPNNWKSLTPRGTVSRREETGLPPQPRNSRGISSLLPPPTPDTCRQRRTGGLGTREPRPAQPPPVTSYQAPPRQCCHLEGRWGTAETNVWPWSSSPPWKDGPRM